MKRELGQVRAFHKKYGYPIDEFRSITFTSDDDKLRAYGVVLEELATALEGLAITEQKDGKPLLYRVHLMIEELGEFITASSKRDAELMLDSLADLLYVVLGTAVSLGLPLDKAFAEIHKSNMTKDHPRKSGARMRIKGKNYKAPDLLKILRRK